MKESVKEASKYGVILSVEIMDDPFMNSISKFLEIKEQIHSPYLQVYPDLGIYLLGRRTIRPESWKKELTALLRSI